jgi:hypothetical protein
MQATDILTVIKSRKLFGFLPRLKSLDTWAAWIVCLKAIFALPMTAEEVPIFQECTGRTSPPPAGSKETYLIIGRRGGKSFISALITCFIACFGDFKTYVTIGETLIVLCLAKDKDQARIVFKYVKSILNYVPALRGMIVEQRADEIELSTGVTIMVKASDFGGIRGPTICAAVCDEIAFWPSQGVNPDNAVLSAIRPAMATIPGAKLLCISTGYAQTGALYEAHRRYFGKDASRDVLVWQADTRTMNPTISQEFIDTEIEKDPEAARAEWLGLFREDISACFNLESIETAIVSGRGRLMQRPGVTYSAFCDMAGGRSDAFTQAIGHREGDKAVVDSLLVIRSPVNPKDVVRQFSDELKAYGLSKVIGDNYGGDWPVSEFRDNQITYEKADKTKSELYLNLVPALNSRKVELPDIDIVRDELRRLERRRGKSGKDTVDHPANGRDDAANSVAGLVDILLSMQVTIDIDSFIAMNRLMPERTMQGQDWGDSPASKFLDPMDTYLDNVRGRGGRWDW